MKHSIASDWQRHRVLSGVFFHNYSFVHFMCLNKQTRPVHVCEDVLVSSEGVVAGCCREPIPSVLVEESDEVKRQDSPRG